MKKIRVGVIGCGRISVRHLSSVVALDNLELAAVCDIKEERAVWASEKYGGRPYTSYEEMIERENLDAVHLCLPHYLHSSVAIYAMERGLHVMTEKPMDVDLESAERATAVSRERGVYFGVISQCRYAPAARLVKKRVSDGSLGKIISARSTLTWTRPDSYYQSSDWKGTWDKEGGGVLIDQAIHSVDLVNWIVDSEVKKISCSMANRGHSILSVEDSAEGLIEYESGTRYGFWCMNNYGCDEPIEIRMLCEGGKVCFGYDAAEIIYNDGRVERADSSDEPPARDGKDYWGNNHIKEIESFYNAISAKAPFELSGENALKTHKLIMKLYKIGKESMK